MSSKNNKPLLGRILGVWAHPDDETFSAGGLMAQAIDAGSEVCCVTATKGEAGQSAIALQEGQSLANVREQEMKAAMNIIGVQDHVWLGYKDGQLQLVDSQEAVGKVQKIVNEFKPDTIVTFGPDGITGHPDHKTVSAWVDELAFTGTVLHVVHTQEDYDDHLQEVDKVINLYFMTEKPRLVPRTECDVSICLTEDILGRKVEAIKAMPSQTLTLTNHAIFEKMKKSLSVENFVIKN